MRCAIGRLSDSTSHRRRHLVCLFRTEKSAEHRKRRRGRLRKGRTSARIPGETEMCKTRTRRWERPARKAKFPTTTTTTTTKMATAFRFSNEVPSLNIKCDVKSSHDTNATIKKEHREDRMEQVTADAQHSRSKDREYRTVRERGHRARQGSKWGSSSLSDGRVDDALAFAKADAAATRRRSWDWAAVEKRQARCEARRQISLHRSR